jgi:hypothetical protein
MTINKIHYKCIILVIATNDMPYFKNARKVWKKYMNINPDIKVLFVYGKLSDSLYEQNTSDIIFNDLEESLESSTILVKTIRAMFIINKYFSYDYFIRTNISTFWNLNIIDTLLQKCPQKMCYAGGHNLSPYFIPIYSNNIINTTIYSGVCIILSPDIVEYILNNISKIIFYIPDDISIGVFLEDIQCNTYTITDRAYYENFSNLDNNVIENEIKKDIDNNCIYYRVKNVNNREYIDNIVYKYLLKKIYNII